MMKKQQLQFPYVDSQQASYMKKVEKITIQDGELLFYPRFFSPEESNDFFTDLKETVDWKQYEIKLN